MIYVIPTAPGATLYFQQTVPLEGSEYIFQFFWSERMSAWALTIYDLSGVPVCASVMLVVNWSLLRRFASAINAPAGSAFSQGVQVPGSPPPGVLMAMDTSGQGEEIAAPTDLGNRVLLMYVTSDDDSLVGVNLGDL